MFLCDKIGLRNYVVGARGLEDLNSPSKHSWISISAKVLLEPIQMPIYLPTPDSLPVPPPLNIWRHYIYVLKMRSSFLLAKPEIDIQISESR